MHTFVYHAHMYNSVWFKSMRRCAMHKYMQKQDIRVSPYLHAHIHPVLQIAKIVISMALTSLPLIWKPWNLHFVTFRIRIPIITVTRKPTWRCMGSCKPYSDYSTWSESVAPLHPLWILGYLLSTLFLLQLIFTKVAAKDELQRRSLLGQLPYIIKYGLWYIPTCMRCT